MDDLKILIINESNAKSIISDFFTFGILIACFFINYNYLGDSNIITILISLCFCLAVYGKITRKVKKMNRDEALEYLKKGEKGEKTIN